MDTLAGSVVATENLESGIAILDNNPAKAEEALSLFAKAAYFGESTALHVVS